MWLFAYVAHNMVYEQGREHLTQSAPLHAQETTECQLGIDRRRIQNVISSTKSKSRTLSAIVLCTVLYSSRETGSPPRTSSSRPIAADEHSMSAG
jgi:hypothetical protein